MISKKKFTIFIIAMLWAYVYNSHFGWNFKSQSNDELLCYGIFLIISSLYILGDDKEERY
jgi:uncharacterized membrane protein